MLVSPLLLPLSLLRIMEARMNVSNRDVLVADCSHLDQLSVRRIMRDSH